MGEKLKYAVVGYDRSHNLGDEVQSIAAARLLPRVDSYIPRERMDEYKADGRTKLLCNGFFMFEPTHWPPAKGIEPLFLSLHISGQYGAPENMLNPLLKDYYNSFGPIGGRDKRTARLFQKLGVDAYFSACVTLTLENRFSPKERTDEILLVDPFYKYNSSDYRRYLEDRIIPQEQQHRVVCLTHRLQADHGMSPEQKIEAAQDLLDRYARASLVITSRIHVGLPCLGLGTPVLFVNAGYDRKHGTERFEGLMDFFNTIEADAIPLPNRKPWFKLFRFLKLHRLFPVTPLSIDFDNPPKNKTLHEPYAAAIRKRVSEWLTK